MTRRDDDELERIKRDVDLVALIQESGVELKRVGVELMGRCLWHGPDTTPSLSVNTSKTVPLWRCFGCGIGGTCIDWVMKRDGVSFRHAKELLAARLVGQTPNAGRERRCTLPAPISLDADDQQLLRDVVDYYWHTLEREPGPRDYLRRRGLEHPELVPTFKLGYANRTLAYRLPPKSKDREDDLRGRLMKVGILREESGHEHLAGSLTVPVFDENGEVVELYGRKILSNLRAGTPKHLYLARKGRGSRGVWNWQGLAEETILCEALIDAMTFWCAGYRNVTATYGCEVLPQDHIDAFVKHGVKRVLIAFDRDEAGDRGAKMVAAKLSGVGIGCFRVTFPHGMDPNDYASKVKPT